MPKYMLLLHDNPAAVGKLGPEEMQQAIGKYMAWRAKPFVVDSNRLDEQTGRLMNKKDGTISITDGLFSEAREVLGGYYTIEAQSFDEAAELSRDHPHLDFGTIEIRHVMTARE